MQASVTKGSSRSRNLAAVLEDGHCRNRSNAETIAEIADRVGIDLDDEQLPRLTRRDLTRR